MARHVGVNEVGRPASWRFGRVSFELVPKLKSEALTAVALTRCDTQGVPAADAGPSPAGKLMANLVFVARDPRRPRPRRRRHRRARARPTPARPISRSSACSAHSSGMIGLPLRLLAREVYNKVVDRVGRRERRARSPARRRSSRRTRATGSRPSRRCRATSIVAFVAIDEVQLGADLERGHVFTDRMLNRRGREETLVLGAATVRPMVEQLLPGANIVQRPRLSHAHLRRRQEAHAAAAAHARSSRSRPTRSTPSPN